MYSFFKKPPHCETKLILRKPSESLERLAAQGKFAYVYVYPTDNRKTSFEYRLTDRENNRFYTGTIQDRTLSLALKRAGSDLGQLTPSEQRTLFKSILLSNVEKMLIQTIQQEQRHRIYEQLTQAKGQEPSKEVLQLCLDQVIDKIFRTPLWYEMLDEAKRELKNTASSSGVTNQ